MKGASVQLQNSLSISIYIDIGDNSGDSEIFVHIVHNILIPWIMTKVIMHTE